MIFAYGISLVHTIIGHVHEDGEQNEYVCKKDVALNSENQSNDIIDHCDDNLYGLLSCLLGQIHHTDNTQNFTNNVSNHLTQPCQMNTLKKQRLIDFYTISLPLEKGFIPHFLYQKLQTQTSQSLLFLRGPPTINS
ncbi:hypothetical protein NH26_01340 [Flammeovirga pacifica]|uniref:Uncharacterized protein n=2 Tax=Flammeovirga pacifica TaxID=915059 RepID=A0A1S1YVM8_FLAPC|nr:hypothetical protein NH26_01340 [Flammeovirga pacifica]